MRIVTIILFILITTCVKAQRSNLGNWFIYSGNQKINSKWNWQNEIQYRNYNFAGDLQQLLFRTGIGYNLTENNNNLLLGYAFIHGQSYLPDSNVKAGANEHRIYQQFITRQQFGITFIQHRYRIEERFLPNDFKVRFRYYLGFNFPVNNKTMKENTLYISAYNEIFLQIQKALFDRNRIYGALGYVINKNFRMEAGMMRQILQTAYRDQFQIVLFNNLPLQKK